MITDKAEIALLLDRACGKQDHLKQTCEALGISFESVKEMLTSYCPNLYNKSSYGSFVVQEIQAMQRVFFSLGIMYGKKISKQ
jgi:hypothetical protein